MRRERSERRRGRGAQSRGAPTKQAAPGVLVVPRVTREKIVSHETPKAAQKKHCAMLYCYAPKNSRITGESVLSYCFIDGKKKAVIKPFTGLKRAYNKKIDTAAIYSDIKKKIKKI